MDKAKKIEFVPFTSCVNPSFWNKLTEIKLDVDKLDENYHDIWGYFSNLFTSTCPKSVLEIDSTSFNKDFGYQSSHLAAHGKILNQNTIEQFKEYDKLGLINREGDQFWQRIVDGEALENPSILNFFFILSYADLKKYHYYYWFAFPVASNLLLDCNEISAISSIFNETELGQILASYEALDYRNKSYFIIERDEQGLHGLNLSTKIKSKAESTNINFDNVYFAFADICSSAEHFGWPLRNFVAFLVHYCSDLKGKAINVVAIRLGRSGSRINLNSSVVINLIVPCFEGKIEWTGWEKSDRGTFGPKFVNLKNSLDPKSIAESAVDLNLKLMKWQLLPEINLDVIKNAKCLLLGAGTLGCSVARTLLAWGVRNITLVDNSYVSFSNPVRQSLFTYEDSVKNKPKALAAAENLQKIFPGVNAKGIQFNIPMPGHSVGESLLQQTKDSVEKLTDLIAENDVIFLLMDSRESRWLPTLLGNHFDKIVINAALGFDTYLVMRHGAKNLHQDIPGVPEVPELKMVVGEKLGCYFCNDITAPGNSLKDRSLDQQCTVTRPGVSAIAGALAVELAVSILQHKYRNRAPAFFKTGTSNADIADFPDESLLGIVPHSIRGFLSNFSHVIPATERYSQCIACSEIVLNEYGTNGFEFLLKVFNSSKYLEELTGLDDLCNDVDEEQVWDSSDEEFST